MSEHDAHDPLRPGARRFSGLSGRTSRRRRCSLARDARPAATWRAPRRGLHPALRGLGGS